MHAQPNEARNTLPAVEDYEAAVSGLMDALDAVESVCRPVRGFIAASETAERAPTLEDLGGVWRVREGMRLTVDVLGQRVAELTESLPYLDGAHGEGVGH